MHRILITASLTLALLMAGCAENVDTASVPPVLQDAGETGELTADARQPTTAEEPGVLAAGAATPAYIVGGTDVLHTFAQEIDERNITGYIIEVSWSHVVPVTHELALSLRAAPTAPGLPTDDPAPQDMVSGPSPLRLVIDAKNLTAEHYSVSLRPTGNPAGVALAQDFLAKITVFEGIPFDPNFLPTSESHH